jgi:hypothetical protein
MRLLTQIGDACNALAGPLTGPAHCALLRVVMRLAGLPRNGALALNIHPQSWKRYMSSTSCEADSLRGVGGCLVAFLVAFSSVHTGCVYPSRTELSVSE